MTARKPEALLWTRIRTRMRGRVRAERIENLVGTGRPDVDTLVAGSFVPIELKASPRWPARQTTAVLGERKGLSLAQRNWHLDWHRWGGRSLVVVEVAGEVFTFNGATADHINHYNIAQFRSAAMVTGIDALVDILERLSR